MPEEGNAGGRDVGTHVPDGARERSVIPVKRLPLFLQGEARKKERPRARARPCGIGGMLHGIAHGCSPRCACVVQYVHYVRVHLRGRAHVRARTRARGCGCVRHAKGIPHVVHNLDSQGISPVRHAAPCGMHSARRRYSCAWVLDPWSIDTYTATAAVNFDSSWPSHSNSNPCRAEGGMARYRTPCGPSSEFPMA